MGAPPGRLQPLNAPSPTHRPEAPGGTCPGRLHSPSAAPLATSRQAGLLGSRSEAMTVGGSRRGLRLRAGVTCACTRGLRERSPS